MTSKGVSLVSALAIGAAAVAGTLWLQSVQQPLQPPRADASLLLPQVDPPKPPPPPLPPTAPGQGHPPAELFALLSDLRQPLACKAYRLGGTGSLAHFGDLRSALAVATVPPDVAEQLALVLRDSSTYVTAEGVGCMWIDKQFGLRLSAGHSKLAVEISINCGQLLLPDDRAYLSRLGEQRLARIYCLLFPDSPDPGA